MTIGNYRFMIIQDVSKDVNMICPMYAADGWKEQTVRGSMYVILII